MRTINKGVKAVTSQETKHSSFMTRPELAAAFSRAGSQRVLRGAGRCRRSRRPLHHGGATLVCVYEACLSVTVAGREELWARGSQTHGDAIRTDTSCDSQINFKFRSLAQVVTQNPLELRRWSSRTSLTLRYKVWVSGCRFYPQVMQAGKPVALSSLKVCPWGQGPCRKCW